MRRILIINLKGGSAKSTTAFLCAQALAKAGRNVSVRDLDPQKSVTGWIQDAGEGIGLGDETSDIEFIDCPPRLDLPEVISAIKTADVILLPSSPSLADTSPTRATADLVRKYVKKGASIRLLFSQVQQGTTLAKHLESIAKSVGVEPLQTMWMRRQCYQHAPGLGWSSLNARAKEEILNAVLEVL